MIYVELYIELELIYVYHGACTKKTTPTYLIAQEAATVKLFISCSVKDRGFGGFGYFYLRLILVKRILPVLLRLPFVIASEIENIFCGHTKNQTRN
jgi:hypothetical protein